MTPLVVDGPSVLYRTACVMTKHPDPGAVAAAMLTRLTLQFVAGRRVVIAWDHPDAASVRRSLLHPTYKAQRVKLRESSEQRDAEFRLFLAAQPYAQAAAERSGIVQYVAPYAEADDLVYRLVFGVDVDVPCVGATIVSSDRDLAQLLRPREAECGAWAWWRLPNDYPLTYDAATEALGVEPTMWSAYRSLMGDRSDNVEGLEGIGKRRAARIMREFMGDIVCALESAHCPEAPKWFRAKAYDALRRPDAAEILLRNFKLMDLATFHAVACEVFDIGTLYPSSGDPDVAEDMLRSSPPLERAVSRCVSILQPQQLSGMPS